MRPDARKRIGLIGFGFIGRGLFERLRSEPEHGVDVAFVHNRSAERVRDLSADLVLDDLADMPDGLDLVVETAHPGVTERWGEVILSRASYLPLSVAALADDALRERLLDRARRSGTRLAIPHGALMGLDSLREWRHAWDSVEITFLKSPENIDFSASGFDPNAIEGETVLYDGPVREIGRLFPRNVNTMVTCALATVGLDRCRGRLVCVPGLPVAVAEVTAIGRDGARLVMRKEQPATGVSGTEMFESSFGSILRTLGAGATLDFV